MLLLLLLPAQEELTSITVSPRAGLIRVSSFGVITTHPGVIYLTGQPTASVLRIPVLSGLINLTGQPAQPSAVFPGPGLIQLTGQRGQIVVGTPPGEGPPGGPPSWPDPPTRHPIGPVQGHPYNPSGTDSRAPGQGIKVLYKGVDGDVDLTRDIQYASASFETRANGEPGLMSFRVNNPGRYSFVTGRMLQLQLRGQPAWTGYISHISHAYVLPADADYEEDGRTHSITPVIDIEGFDLNGLLRRRWLKNKDDDVKQTIIFPAHTKDTTAITELIRNWLDLSDDPYINVQTGVENVADINVGEKVGPFGIGFTWEQAIFEINRLPAAVYTIDPDGTFIYSDSTDVANAPFGLTDRPKLEPDAAVYREMEILHDGADLVTDALIWGAGTGSKEMVFSRLQSDPQGHGLWQAGEVHYDVYKQGTADRIANALVMGSPSNHRGHRLDKISISLITYVPGFRAGQRVDFWSHAFGFHQVIPIRQLRITFPTPGMPRFELTMSHEIDAPWNIFDVFYPKPDDPDPGPPTGPDPNPDIAPCITSLTPVVSFSDEFHRIVPDNNGDWGDGGCGPWFTLIIPGQPQHSHFTPAFSPPPYCIVLAFGSGAAGTFSDTDPGSHGAAFARSFLITFTASFIRGQIRDQWGNETVSDNIAHGSAGFPSWIRVMRMPGRLLARMWRQQDLEPEEWQVDIYAPMPPPGVISDTMNMASRIAFPPGSPRPTFMGVSSGGGQGYVWVDSSETPVSIYSQGDLHSWDALWLPEITDPPEPPVFPAAKFVSPRPDSFEITNVSFNGNDAKLLEALEWNYWNWSSDAADFRVTQRLFRYVSFYVPIAGMGVRLQARVYVYAPHPLALDQPPPSGEGPISFSIDVATYDGDQGSISDNIDALDNLTQVGFGIVPDYTFDDDPPSGSYVDIDVGLPVSSIGPDRFVQLTGRITDEASMIGLHGPYGGPLVFGSPSRQLHLKMRDIKIVYTWLGASECNHLTPSGTGTEVGTGLTEAVVTLDRPYFLGTTKIWKNGHLIRVDTDYVESDALIGEITLLVTPLETDYFVFTYMPSTYTGGMIGVPPTIRPT